MGKKVVLTLKQRNKLDTIQDMLDNLVYEIEGIGEEVVPERVNPFYVVSSKELAKVTKEAIRCGEKLAEFMHRERLDANDPANS